MVGCGGVKLGQWWSLLKYGSGVVHASPSPPINAFLSRFYGIEAVGCDKLRSDAVQIALGHFPFQREGIATGRWWWF